MKRLLLIFILTLSFQSWAKADDIKDFEIEGMSLGDSALDYFTENEIKKNIMWEYNDDKKNNEFVVVEFYNYKSAKQYDGIQIAIKPEDKEYKIYIIVGALHFENIKIEDCYDEMEKIDAELSNMFSSASREKDDYKLTTDITDKSKITSVYYHFADGGNASVQCYYYSKNYVDSGAKNNLKVAIRSSEYRKWYFSSLK
jgi:hypothetical protein